MKAAHRFTAASRLPVSPLAPFRDTLKNWYLVRRLTDQDLALRYRDSVMGPLWVFLIPLSQLLVFSLIFGTVFPSRWHGGSGGLEVALNIFCGIVVFAAFSEAISRSASVLLQNRSYITKVVFPLETLPVSVVAVAAVNLLVSLGLLVAVVAVTKHGFGVLLSIVYLPLILAPFLVMLLGLCWLIASSAVYVRDIGHAIGPATNLMMFLSPVLYPLSALPEVLRWVVYLNPISVPIEQLRVVVLQQAPPNFLVLLVYSLAACAVAWAGYLWFSVLRKGFADVV